MTDLKMLAISRSCVRSHANMGDVIVESKNQ